MKKNAPCLRTAALALLLFALLPAAVCAKEGVREPLLAGGWYPASPSDLRASVKDYIEQGAGERDVAGELVGLIAPHAGYVYSGAIAGRAYAVLQQQPADTVIVVAPSHHHPFMGMSVYDQGGYRTPLGVMELDRELIEALRERLPDLRYVPQAHDREHSLEIQIPFLQVATPGAKIVPLVMGQQGFNVAMELGKALAGAVQASSGKRVVLVASSDLSHFHEKQQCAELDARIKQAVRAMDAHSIATCMASRACEACGAGPMIAVLFASELLGASESVVLASGDSSTASGDEDRVVGYMAAAFLRGEVAAAGAQQAAPAQQEAGEYDAAERKLLHEVAREAIAHRMRGESYELPPDIPEHLRAERGVFVTLKRKGRLRGCIGHVVGEMPLVEAVAQMAEAAAFRDPRFEPVDREELDSLEYEISVLTPPRRISNVESIEVGRHGLIMKRGTRQGLLLPQVPKEFGWDRKAFLQHTCRKAGMPLTCWQDPDTEIAVFSAEVF